MILIKYFELLKLFLNNYAGESYGRMLAGKVRMSQKAVALALTELERKGILKSRSEGRIKYYSLNTEYSGIKDLITILETARKIDFLADRRELAYILKKDSRIVGVFGSHARDTQKKDSDIDVFVIGARKTEDYEEKGKLFDIDISIKYFKQKEWETLLKEKNHLVNEIVGNHVVIFGAESFVNMLWRHYYSFN